MVVIGFPLSFYCCGRVVSCWFVLYSIWGWKSKVKQQARNLNIAIRDTFLVAMVWILNEVCGGGWFFCRGFRWFHGFHGFFVLSGVRGFMGTLPAAAEGCFATEGAEDTEFSMGTGLLVRLCF